MHAPKIIDDRYEILELLSTVADREEFRAHDRTLAREVLLIRQSNRRASEAGSLREARALSALRHPGMQQLYDVFTSAGSITMVLEPIAGETLAERLEREPEGRLPHAEVRRIAAVLASALSAIHSVGVVHRDVGEDAILLGADNSVCLTGFRFAKPIAPMGGTSIQYEELAAESDDNPALPTHPAPEQLGGEAASERSDLFALGCVLYRALTGRDAMPDMLDFGWKAPTPIASLVSGVPRDLAALIMVCLARAPLGRPKSAAEVRKALAVEIDEGSSRESIARPRSKNGLVAAAVVVSALAIWQLVPRNLVNADLVTRTPASVEPVGAPVLADTPNGAASKKTRFAQGFGRSVALLIGIGEAYPKNDFTYLSNAVGDVEAIGDALRLIPLANWEIVLLRNSEATFDGIRAALTKLEQELEYEDRVLVYFAGHGFANPRAESNGWIIPADGQSEERDRGQTKWLSFGRFEEFIENTDAKHVMLAMDCCYSGRVGMGAMRGSDTHPDKLGLTTYPAKIILSSGRANEQVFDGVPGQNSPFARVFIDCLRSKTVVTSSSMFAQMQDALDDPVYSQTPGRQSLTRSAQDDFVFIGREEPE